MSEKLPKFPDEPHYWRTEKLNKEIVHIFESVDFHRDTML